jgi:hypothetical protein
MLDPASGEAEGNEEELAAEAPTGEQLRRKWLSRRPGSDGARGEAAVGRGGSGRTTRAASVADIAEEMRGGRKWPLRRGWLRMAGAGDRVRCADGHRPQVETNRLGESFLVRVLPLPARVYNFRAHEIHNFLFFLRNTVALL